MIKDLIKSLGGTPNAFHLPASLKHIITSQFRYSILNICKLKLDIETFAKLPHTLLSGYNYIRNFGISKQL